MVRLPSPACLLEYHAHVGSVPYDTVALLRACTYHIDARVGGGMALVADLYYALHEPQMMQIYPFVYVRE